MDELVVNDLAMNAGESVTDRLFVAVVALLLLRCR